MHCVFDYAGGELWLGGSQASGRVDVLLANGINHMVSCGGPPVARDGRITYHGAFDGTALVHDRVNFDAFMAGVDNLSNVILTGGRVLVVCRNGAHRSATVAATLLVYMTGREVQEIAHYLGAA